MQLHLICYHNKEEYQQVIHIRMFPTDTNQQYVSGVVSSGSQVPNMLHSYYKVNIQRIKMIWWICYPQNDLVWVVSLMPSLERPKSVNFAFPNLSRTTLSGLRSLKITSYLCNSSKARIIWAV